MKTKNTEVKALEIPRGFAGIEAINHTFKAQSITSLFEQYKKGAFGNKNLQREKSYQKALLIKNISARILAFFVALYRQGYVGTLAPLDVLSDALKTATGGKGEARTIRRALNELAALGWITKQKVKTGTMISTPKGDLALCVLRIEFCPTLWDIVGNSIQPSYSVPFRPKRPPIPKIKAKPRGTISRSPLALAVTNGRSTIGAGLVACAPQTPVEQKEVSQLTASTSVPSVSSVHTSNQERRATVPAAYTSDRVEPIATNEESKAKMDSKKEVLATYEDFLNSFVSAVQNHVFSTQNDNAIRIITATKNHLSKSYPKKAFGLKIDLIQWSCLDWLERRKIAADFAKKIEKIIFGDNSAFDGFLVPQCYKFDATILNLVFDGRLNIANVSGENLKNWNLIFDFGELKAVQ